MFAAGQSFTILIISRVLGGFSAGMVMPGVTGMIADISPGADKAKTLVTCRQLLIQVYIRTWIWRLLAEISHRLPFYVAGTLGVVAFIMSVLLIHNPQKQLQMDSTNINLNYSLKLIGKYLLLQSY